VYGRLNNEAVRNIQQAAAPSIRRRRNAIGWSLLFCRAIQEYQTSTLSSSFGPTDFGRFIATDAATYGAAMTRSMYGYSVGGGVYTGLRVQIRRRISEIVATVSISSSSSSSSPCGVRGMTSSTVDRIVIAQ